MPKVALLCLTLAEVREACFSMEEVCSESREAVELTKKLRRFINEQEVPPYRVNRHAQGRFR